jgi:lipopolysaccharide transport system permease protein
MRRSGSLEGAGAGDEIDHTYVSRYGPDSQLRHPRQFLRETARGLRGARAVAGRLLIRDLRSRYRQSLLGYVWLFAPTIGATIVWIFLNASNIVNTGDTRVPYPIYVLVGNALWQTFVDGLNSPVNQLSSAANLLNKMNFPAESLLVAGFGNVMLNAAIRLLLVVPVLIWYGISPGWTILAMPIGLTLLATLAFAIGLVLAPIGALYRDVPQGMLLLTSFWFLVTPVAYAIPTSGVGKALAVVNPVVPLLNVTRDWITGGAFMPSTSWFVASACGCVLFAVGWLFFRLSVPHLVDRIGG